MVNKLWRRILDWSSCCQKIFDTLRFIRLLNEVSEEEKNNIYVLQHCIALPPQYKENLITCYRHPSDHFKT